MSYIICELDSVISDDKWREQHINIKTMGMHRLHNYHLLAGFDDVCNEQLFRDDKHELIILTNRPVFYSVITYEWLRKHDINPKAMLFRPTQSTMSPRQQKYDQLMNLFRLYEIKKEDIVAAYDYRHEVCKMYRTEGIHAEQVLNLRKDGDDEHTG
ncbi:hypothetical protein KAR91_21470 [Candidatus Pacearchaeota archaeon]|nr:hypothetical protein [Candidatus Pacearchaeota archaeon]